MEEKKSKKVHCEGYEVSNVTIHMKTVYSDQDFEKPPSSREAVYLHLKLVARHADSCVVREKGKIRTRPRHKERVRELWMQREWQCESIINATCSTWRK